MEDTTADVVRAKRVEVVDEKGRVRVVLGWLWDAEDAMYGVGVHGDAGSLLAWVAADAASPEVGIASRGNVVAVLQVGREGEGQLALADAASNPTAS